jgi:hypothetical protein
MSATTESLLQTINATLVTNAPTTWPSSLGQSDLSIALIRPSEGASQQVAGQLRETRIYEVVVLLAERHQKTLATAKTSASSLLPSFSGAYTSLANKVLQSTPTYIQINSHLEEGVTDTGFTEIEDFYGKHWYGFIFRVSISEYPNP